jgi:hypothetical protein
VPIEVRASLVTIRQDAQARSRPRAKPVHGPARAEGAASTVTVTSTVTDTTLASQCGLAPTRELLQFRLRCGSPVNEKSPQSAFCHGSRHFGDGYGGLPDVEAAADVERAEHVEHPVPVVAGGHAGRPELVHERLARGCRQAEA